LITSSKAVVKRFDQNITPFLSPDKNILLIAENNGVLWMISLLPNLFPSYTDKGFVFTQDISADKGI